MTAVANMATLRRK